MKTRVEPASKQAAEPQAEKSRAGGRRWRDALGRELREHPFGYTVLGLFVLAGPIGASLLFPQAPIGVTVVGGLAFGAYAALCAVPQKFI
ncbi:MAG TPA: hypothetical protein VKA74_06925 [Myxococcota bacterium]|nr:hypothetical protein [Myxococcota bacterium]